ncbi:MAG: hypothetical protein NW217_06895 [Hyphomicrobiaceae bacterium]|nr:hypothetical protein [Hyphomicrobiaceae bacterium]
MTRKMLLVTTAGVVLGALALGLASDASARWGDGEGSGKGGWHRGHGKHGPDGYRRMKGSGMRMLLRLDADRNGEVTLAEAHQARDARFAILDKNADGLLSADELVSRTVERMDYMQHRTLKNLDASGDGKVTKDDFETAAKERFAARDFNGNGTIEADEMPPGKGKGKGWRKGKGRDWDDDGRGPRREGRGRDGDRDQSADADDEPAGADEGPRKGGRWSRGGGRTLDQAIERAGRRFARMDDNKDGVISAEEVGGRMPAAKLDYMKRARLHRADADKDGSVTKEEFRAAADKRFTRMDLDGDGRITAADLPPGAGERWARMMGKTGGTAEQK